MILNVKILDGTQINPNFLKQTKSHYFPNTNHTRYLNLTKLLCVQEVSLKGQKKGHFILLKYGFEN